MKNISLILLTLLFLQCSTKTQHNDTVYSDGLVRSTPEAEDVQSQGILDFIESIEKKEIKLHSFILLRHGKVVAEGWWDPYKPDTRHIMYSVSKIFTSTAVGFAVNEKLLSLDDKVVSFFPEYKDAYAANPYMQELTVRNLITMTAGNEPWPDFRMRNMDWVNDFLSADLNEKTANRFIYNSYATYMASVIIQRVTGSTMLDYLKPRLFEPLGISDIASEQSPSGFTCGGWGMSVLTADMAKLGQLYLQKGKWNGEQLLPESWIEEASSMQIDNGANLSPSERAQTDWGQGYGYFIWQCRHNAFRADGAFGQLIVVMPDQDAVLVATADTHDMGKELQQVWDHILPAISDKELPENKDAYKALTAKLESLALPEPNMKTEKDKNPDFAGTYTMEKNDLGIVSIEIKQQNNLCNLILRTGSATHNLTTGNNKWEYSVTDRNSPYYNQSYRNPIGLSPFKVAGYYTWKDAQNLLLKLVYLEDSSFENYKITLDGKKINLLYTNSEDDSKPIELIGSLN